MFAWDQLITSLWCCDAPAHGGFVGDGFGPEIDGFGPWNCTFPPPPFPASDSRVVTVAIGEPDATLVSESGFPVVNEANAEQHALAFSPFVVAVPQTSRMFEPGDGVKYLVIAMLSTCNRCRDRQS
jgi:hypothetical protein